MRISAPSKIVFLISLIVAILSVASHIVGLVGGSLTIPFFTAHAYLCLGIAYLVLLLGVTIRGL